MANAVMVCMRNEAMFVTEWVAYHRLIGFDHVFVCTNNCTDGTDAILDHLQGLGLVHHVRNDDLGGLPPQPAGVLKVLAHPQIAACDWLLHIDADEFLNVQFGEGQLSELTRRAAPFDAMGFTWRHFGDSGMTDWKGGSLLQQQQLAEQRQATMMGSMQKTMFRPNRFLAGNAHMPKQPVDRNVTLCNARGMPLDPSALFDPDTSDLRVAFGREVNRKRHFGWEGAYVNHYAVRTPDIFALKNVRGTGAGSRFSKRHFLNSRWHRAANRNDIADPSIQRHLPALTLVLDKLRQSPDLVALEAFAAERFRAMKETYLTPENLAAWTEVA